MRSANLAPMFTPESARKAQEKGYQTKIQQKNAEIEKLKRELATALIALQDDEQARKSILRMQMAKCDEMMTKTRDPADFKRWAESKAKLWELLYPKPGILRPGKTRDRMPATSPIAPLPIEPASPLVAPSPEQNHNAKIVQSQVVA